MQRMSIEREHEIRVAAKAWVQMPFRMNREVMIIELVTEVDALRAELRGWQQRALDAEL